MGALRIAVASERDAKIDAVKLAVDDQYPDNLIEVVGRKVSSGVSDQPMTDEETLRGAKNRAWRLLENYQDIDIAAGLEGGIREVDEGLFVVTGVVYLLDRSGVIGLGEAPGVPIPDDVMKLIHGINNAGEGMDMSEAVSQAYGTDTLTNRDCTGVITDGYLSATDYYRIATRIAFMHYDANRVG